MINISEIDVVLSKIFSMEYAILNDRDKVARKLIKRLSVARRKNMYLFLRGLVAHNSKESEIAKKDIFNLQKEFDKLISVKREYKTLDERFLDVEGVSLEEKKRVIDELFKSKTKEVQDLITNYLNGMYKCSTKEGTRAINEIEKLKVEYYDYFRININLVRFYKEFPDIPNLRDEVKRMIIDILVLTLDLLDKDNLDRYIKRLVRCKSDAGIRAKKSILDLKRVYNSLSFNIQKLEEYLKCLKLIEYKYRVLGLSGNEYLEFRETLLREIIKEVQEFDLEIILEEYIKRSYVDMKDYELDKAR